MSLRYLDSNNHAFFALHYLRCAISNEIQFEVLKKYIKLQGAHDKEKTSAPKKSYGSRK